MHAQPILIYLLLAVAMLAAGGGACLLLFVFCLRNVRMTPDEPDAFK